MGAACGAIAAVGATAVGDLARGELSSGATYLRSAVTGGIVGAVTGGLFGPIGGASSSLAPMTASQLTSAYTGMLATGFASGYTDYVLTESINGRRPAFSDAMTAGAYGAMFSGALVLFKPVKNAIQGLFQKGIKPNTTTLNRPTPIEELEVNNNRKPDVEDGPKKVPEWTGNVAPSAHPGKIAAESTEVSYESIIRALRQNGSRDAYATLALLKRGKVDFTIKEKGPTGVGGQYFFNSRKVEIYTKYATTPERAAGITAHEVKHWMQKLNSRNYTKQSEFEAFIAQRNVDKTWFLRTEEEIWNFINSHPAYKKLLK
ncbi:hypothetical protein HMSSN036_20580 [Paenibacillus macerans]|nr:hypothetical protein HMSSN036_20580 [Paenibacillus macerans]